MKKLFVLFIIVLFAAPAMAVDWNFYGSARTIAWYVDEDLGDFTNAAGDDDDDGMLWGSDGHDNARFGAKVKHENVRGRVEIQMRADDGGDPSSVITTESRLLYGEWDFGGGTLLVGKAYTPVAQFISGQAFDEDIGLLSIGAAYGNRINGLQLSFGGFTIALLEPEDSTGVPTAGDVDSYLPKIEAKFGMGFDMFNFNIIGGYQTYEVETTTFDYDVDSYIIGGDVGVNFGPAYVKGAISYGENVSNAAWDVTGLYTAGAFATFDGVSDVDDTETLMFAAVAGFKMSDMVSFEAGFGYREDDPDVTGAKEDEAWVVYLQAPLRIAPMVTIIPEVGFFDFEKNAADQDEGDKFYIGSKFQIDF